MKLWMAYVAGTILCWGAYIPLIHSGQSEMRPTVGRNAGVWAFLVVGGAYFLVAVLMPLILLYSQKAISPVPPQRGLGIAFAAGVLGAIGALCVILALRAGGTPLEVPPLVFAGAPLVASLVAMLLHRPEKAPEWQFYLGIVMAAAGASLIMRYKPS